MNIENKTILNFTFWREADESKWNKIKEKSKYISIIYYSSIENDILFNNIYKKYSIYYNNKKIKFYKVYN